MIDIEASFRYIFTVFFFHDMGHEEVENTVLARIENSLNRFSVAAYRGKIG